MKATLLVRALPSLPFSTVELGKAKPSIASHIVSTRQASKNNTESRKLAALGIGRTP